MSSNFGNTFGILRTIIDKAEVPPLVLAVMSAPYASNILAQYEYSLRAAMCSGEYPNLQNTKENN